MSEFESWREIAERHRGRWWVVPSTLLDGAMPGLNVEIGQARIYGQVHAESFIRSESLFLARYVAGAGPAFEVYREPMKAKIIDSPDLVLGGNEKFDSRYSVHGSDIVLLREQFDDRIKHVLSNIDAKIASDGFELSLSIPGFLENGWALGMAVLTLRKVHANRQFTSGRQVKITRRSVKAVVLVSNMSVSNGAVLKLLFGGFTRSLPVAENPPKAILA